MRLQFFRLELNNTLTPVEGGWIDGYHVGDRLLENVMFFCSIDPKGKIAVQVRSSDSGYFNNLAKKKWLTAIREYAATNDCFHSTDAGTDDDIVLYDHDLPPQQQQFCCPNPVVLNVTA